MKTMLVTGASSGIGRALAIRASRAGYAVYAVGRNAAALDALRAGVEAEDGFITTEALDIATAANARGLIERALARYGSLDVLVNNAGFTSSGPLAAQSDDELQRQFGTHVVGPVALVREAHAALRAAHGHVFMLGSGVARVPLGGLGAYPPAKAALRSATAILRRELRADGIAVTYVDPGAVNTPFMTRAGMPGAPAAMLASPESVARKILIAVAKRPPVLNAVPWQTTGVALAQAFPGVTEMLLARAPGLVGVPAPPRAVRSVTRQPGPVSQPPQLGQAGPLIANAQPDEAQLDNAQPHGALAMPEAEAVAFSLALRPPAVPPDSPPDTREGDAAAKLSDGLSAALEPHRRRMEKLKFRESFVRELLVAGTSLDAGDVALRWAGMPNKHERAITEEVLAALADAGFLERTADQRYVVARGAQASARHSSNDV